MLNQEISLNFSRTIVINKVKSNASAFLIFAALTTASK